MTMWIPPEDLGNVWNGSLIPPDHAWPWQALRPDCLGIWPYQWTTALMSLFLSRLGKEYIVVWYRVNLMLGYVRLIFCRICSFLSWMVSLVSPRQRPSLLRPILLLLYRGSPEPKMWFRSTACAPWAVILDRIGHVMSGWKMWFPKYGKQIWWNMFNQGFWKPHLSPYA